MILRPVRFNLFFSLLIALTELTSCERDDASRSAFGLRTVKLTIQGVPIKAEVADTPESSTMGLMYRASLPENQGMLFVFNETRQADFWMKNTRIPLSVAFIDPNQTILEIRSMKPFDETNVYSSSNQIAYALEMNEGWFLRNGIEPGAKVNGIVKR